MKTGLVSLALVGIALISIPATGTESGRIRRLDGRVLEYPYLDSIITISFTEQVSDENARNLALQHDGLRDDYIPWTLDNRLFVFALNPGARCDTVIEGIRTNLADGVVNPVLEGMHRTPTLMGDQLIVAFYPGTEQSVIDSLNRMLATEVRNDINDPQ